MIFLIYLTPKTNSIASRKFCHETRRIKKILISALAGLKTKDDDERKINYLKKE